MRKLDVTAKYVVSVKFVQFDSTRVDTIEFKGNEEDDAGLEKRFSI